MFDFFNIFIISLFTSTIYLSLRIILLYGKQVTNMDKHMFFPQKNELVKHICKLMRKHKIRQQEIEVICGIPQSTISQLIGKNKKRHPLARGDQY